LNPAVASGRWSEFRPGWKMLLAATVGVGTGASPIPTIAIGHLTKPIQAEFGWGRGEVQLAMLCFSCAVLVLSPFYGALIDRIGVRKVAIGALLLFALSWMAIAFSPANVPLFYLLWAISGAVGGASIPISWTRGVSSWFVVNRGLALAIALTGTGLAGLAMNLGLPHLIGATGWRGAILVIGLFPLLLGVPLAIAFFHDRPPPAPAATGRDGEAVVDTELDGVTFAAAVADRRFWIMFASFGAIALAFGGLYTNYVPLLTDKGFAPADAGLVAGMIGLSIIGGRLAAGYLIDRFWAPLIALPMLALPALSCAMLMQADLPMSHAILAGVLLGFAAGIEADLIAYLAGRYFGLRHYGKIYGLLYVSFGACSAISAPLYASAYDLFGTYDAALVGGGILFLAGAALLLLIGPYPLQGASPRPE
jgi:MFS family permease